MPQPTKISTGTTAYSFQSFDGSNQTIVGLDGKLGLKNGSVSTFVGGSTDFKGKNQAVIDLKGSMPYDKKGIFSQNIRLRHNINGAGTNAQVRYSPLTVTIPLGKNTSAYANPHYVGKYDYQTNKWSNGAGAFVGASQKVDNKTTVSLEGQLYNLQDINSQNWKKNASINAIVSYKF